MSEQLVHELADRAKIALAEARQRRLAFADLSAGIGDPPWELLLCLCSQLQDKAQSDVAALAVAAGLSELVTRRHLAVLCEAGLAWVELHPGSGVAVHAGLTSEGRQRIGDILLQAPLSELSGPD
jgi:hypothetical protein